MKVTLELEYIFNEREKEALEELLPFWQQYKGENGICPFRNWGIEKLLETFIETGIKIHVSKQIKLDQWRKGIISIDEMLNKDRFRTKEERERLETEKGEEQC